MQFADDSISKHWQVHQISMRLQNDTPIPSHDPSFMHVATQFGIDTGHALIGHMYLCMTSWRSDILSNIKRHSVDTWSSAHLSRGQIHSLCWRESFVALGDLCQVWEITPAMSSGLSQFRQSLLQTEGAELQRYRCYFFEIRHQVALWEVKGPACSGLTHTRN